MDIIMCLDNNCPLKETCLRFKGEINKYRQSYFEKSPLNNNECEYYYEIKQNTPITEKEEMELFCKNLSKFIKND